MYKVLIIDDEPWSREVVKELGAWESLSLEVSAEAEDGSEGLTKLKDLAIDLVITDMRMPGIEGVELLRTMSTEFPDVKILVMSGYNDFVYLKQAIQSRAMEYLLKPINAEELNAALKRSVDALDKDKLVQGLQWHQQFIQDDAIREQYITCRLLLSEALLSVDKTAALNVLDHLKQLLNDADKAEFNRVGNSILLHTKQFLYDNMPDAERLLLASKHWEYLDEMISFCQRTCSAIIDRIVAGQKDKGKTDVDQVKAYIERNYKEPISLETAARFFHVSREHLSRLFKAQTSETFTDYVTSLRMNKAKELIVENRLEIKDVAEMMGFMDIAYFYRVFKKYFGITPGEMQKGNGCSEKTEDATSAHIKKVQ